MATTNPTVNLTNDYLPVVFKQSNTATANAMSNTTTYPITPGTLYFTTDNYLVRDYYNADGAKARAIIKSAYAASCNLSLENLGSGKFVNAISVNGSTISVTKAKHTHTVQYQKATGATVAVPDTYSLSYESTAVSLSNGKTSGVTVSAHSYTPAGSVTITSGAVGAGQTANYTPAGTISQPTFTGSATTLAHAAHTHTISLTSSANTSVTHAAHSHTVSGAVDSDFTGTAATLSVAGSVSQPTFTGTGVEYTPGGSTTSKISTSYDSDNECLTFTRDCATTFTGTKATITAKGTVSKPSFTGTSISYTPTGTVESTFKNGAAANVTVAAHSIAIPDGASATATTIGSHSYTPSGAVSKPTFAGTGVILSSAFSGTAASLAHTVTQGTVSGSVKYDKTTSVATNTTKQASASLSHTTTTATTSEI